MSVLGIICFPPKSCRIQPFSLSPKPLLFAIYQTKSSLCYLSLFDSLQSILLTLYPSASLPSGHVRRLRLPLTQHVVGAAATPALVQVSVIAAARLDIVATRQLSVALGVSLRSELVVEGICPRMEPAEAPKGINAMDPPMEIVAVHLGSAARIPLIVS